MKRYPQYRDSGISWIGEVPVHWKIEPFGRFFQYFKGLSITKADLLEDGIPVVSYGQIHAKTNIGTRITPDLLRFVSSDFLKSDRQSLVKKGDFIFADTSEDLDGCGNCVFVDQNETIFAGYHTLVCRPQGIAYAKFLAYQFLSSSWRNQLRENCNGVKVFSISRGKLKKTQILTPPQEEQEAIVDFLDQATAKIDAFIELKEVEIEKLGVLKQSIISHVVTRGLDPNVPMKDSGISWIGEVPAYWNIRPIGSLATLKSICGHIEKELLSVYLDKGVVRFSDIKERRTNATSQDLSKYQLVEPGDFVLNNQQAWRGSVGVSTLTGIVSPAYFVASLSEDLQTQYANYLLRSPSMVANYYISSKGVGSIQRNLDWQDFKRCSVLVPPKEEQLAIVDFLNRKIQEIDGFIANIHTQIEKVKIYRQRLISDAVTGKIDVRNTDLSAGSEIIEKNTKSQQTNIVRG